MLSLLLKLGPALTILKGAHSPEVEEVYRRARALAEEVGDQAELFKSVWGQWLSANLGRRTEQARQRAEELVVLGRKSDDPDLLLEAFHCRWSTAFFLGEVEAALSDSREGIQRYDMEKHSWMGPIFGGHDPGVCAHSVHGMALVQAGRFAGAASAAEQALALGRTLKHPYTLTHAIYNAMVTYQMAGNRARVKLLAQEMVELAEKYAFPPQRAAGIFLSAWADSAGPDFAAAHAVMEAEYGRATSLGPMPQFYTALLGAARVEAGRAADALPLVTGMIETLDARGVGFCLSELHRVRGACLEQLDPGNVEAALQAYDMAAALAARQGSRAFELRAALGMARLSGRLGDATRGMARLAAIHQALRVEMAGPEMEEARQLLAAAGA